MTLSVAESAAQTSAAPAVRAGRWGELRASLRENSPLIALVIAYGVTPFIVTWLFDIGAVPYRAFALTYLGMVATTLVAFFAAFALWYLYNSRIRKVPNFQKLAWPRVRGDFLSRERVMLALPFLLLWPIMAMAFSFMKGAISDMQPFYLDPALHQLDRAIHFGIEPWRLLQPLLGHTAVTYLINVGYAMWLFVLQVVLVLQAGAAGNRQLRLRFLLSMALAWVLVGSLAATLLSSAGPCYYALVVNGPDPYAPLMAYLRGVADNLTIGDVKLPFTALMLQDLLWQGYSAGDHSIAKGISAAPSMHLASTWLIWRLAWTMGRPARIFGSCFLAFIFIGSIHLGWHYAVDGYIAIVLAWAIWRAVGWLLDRARVQAFLWPRAAASADHPATANSAPVNRAPVNPAPVNPAGA